MGERMIIVYVGDVTEYLSTVALKAYPTATLLTGTVVNDIPPGAYYTSIGDLDSLLDFAKVLMQSDLTVYAPPDKWSDSFFGKSKMQIWTEDYLAAFAHHGKLIQNLPAPNLKNKSTMLKLSDPRKIAHPQLWIAGCSISHGIGVSDKQRYGQILSEQLNLSVSFLTRESSSVIWAADQILRSDLKEDDILIWGLTSIPRLPLFSDNKLHHVNPTSTNFQELLVHYNEDVLYRSLTSVYQVINFCKKIKIELFLVNLLDDMLVNYLKDDVEVLSLSKLWGRDPGDLFVDVGTDGRHPGIKSHAFYAEEILKKIKERT